MPGNEVGDRVHNFFAQDNLSQGHHHSQVVDGNWPVLNNNLWVGSQRQGGVSSSNPKNYTPHQSDFERGHISHPLHVPHGLHYTQPSLRPEFAHSQSQSQQPNLNGFMYGGQVFQTRHDEANFLGVDTESDQLNLTPKSLSIYESQQGNGPEHPKKTSVTTETFESPVSFDFFGGQQQMSSQLPGMLQPLAQQQSGFNDMQQLQQEVMFGKMQELQRQKELQQVDARQQNSVNNISSFVRPASGNHSHALINGTPISDASDYRWATELTAGNRNWQQHASPMQGSSSGLVFSPELGQLPRSMGLVHQQVDQSLYGAPISSSRGSPNQYHHIAIDKPSVQQMSTHSNSFPGNQYAVFPEQATMQDGTLSSRQGFQGKNVFGHASGQGIDGGINVENLQQLNPLQRNAPVQEFQGRQELVGPSDILQEKTAFQAASSDNAVALDPTEEKILFGSDDNIWDAFGRSTNMNGGASNLLDGTGSLNGLPSLQSGSWSALMQSAVAETSSTDIGLQEGWTGLSFQNHELPTGSHQPSTFKDSEKRQPSLGDDNLQIASAFSFGSVPLSEDANVNNNYNNAVGFQQFGEKVPYEHGERQQINYSHQSPGGSKWLNRGPLREPLAGGSEVYGKASYSMDAEMNKKSSSAHGNPRQNGASQPCNKINNWNIMETVSPSGDASINIHENDNSLQDSQSNDQKRVRHEEVSHGDGLWKVNTVPNSTLELEPVKSTVGSPQVNLEASSLNNAAAVPNSSKTRAACEETSQFLPNSHDHNYWKHVDSVVKSKGSELSGKSQHHRKKGPQVLEAPLDLSDKEEVKMPVLDNLNTKENSNNSHRSKLSYHTSAGGLREHILSDASDTRTLSAGKQKSSNQVGRKASGPPKFHYHPMGNLDEDVEPSYGMRQATHSQAMSQQSSRGLNSQDQGYFGQSKLFGQVPRDFTEMGKGQIPDLQGGAKGFDETLSMGILPGYVPNMSIPFNRSVGTFAPNKDSQSSQNMLELLHKVDQSRESGTMMQLSSECNSSSEMPEAENSDGSGGRLPRNQSSASQGYGLQLAPPSQRLHVPNHASQRSTQTDNSFSSTQATPEIRDKGRSQFAPSSSVQSLPLSHETSQGDFKNNRIGIPGQTGNEASLYKMPGKLSSTFNSSFPYLRSQFQNQQMTVARGQVSTNQSINVSFDRHAPYSKQADNYHPHESIPAPIVSVGEALSVSQPFTTSGISQQGAFSKVLPNIWTNIPAQQHFLGAQARMVQSNLSQFRQSNIVESSSSAPQNLEDQDAKKKGNVPSEFGASSVNSQSFVCGEVKLTKDSPHQQVSSGNTELVQKMDESQGKDPIIKHLSHASSVKPALTRRDIEAFGRSLKPNNFSHQNYSLLNQMQAMKNADTDPSNRGLKRFKGPDDILGGQQAAPKAGQPNEHNTMVTDALVHRMEVPPGDSKMLSFSGPVDNLERNASSQLGNIPSRDILASSQNESRHYSLSHNTASVVGVEHSQISPQMAPSLFNQYGTFKNGQMLTMYDAQKVTTVKTVEQPFAFGRSSGSLQTLDSIQQGNVAADTTRIGSIRQNSTPASVEIEHISPLHSLSQDVGSQNFVVLRPKKRKSATSEFHPWHKEVSLGSRSLQTISMAEVDWANAANRLTEKVEDDAETIEDRPPMLRPKRRLVLTTQLMQQLLRPPPAAILSGDASLNYETVAYYVARLALGNACSLVSLSRSYSNVPPDGANSVSDNCKTTKRIDGQHLSELVEGFTGRAMKLENDLLRLEKKTSVLDLRVECQDLEKFSVINRFAKFHGRGQAEGAETSSSSDVAANAQKSCPQRYVTALPLPRNLPDRVQYLSL